MENEQRIDELATNYNISELCRIGRESYRDMIITFRAILERAEQDGQCITDLPPSRHEEITQKLINGTDPDDLTDQELITLIQGGILGYGRFGGDALENLTQLMEGLHDRLK